MEDAQPVVDPFAVLLASLNYTPHSVKNLEEGLKEIRPGVVMVKPASDERMAWLAGEIRRLRGEGIGTQARFVVLADRMPEKSLKDELKQAGALVVRRPYPIPEVVRAVGSKTR